MWYGVGANVVAETRGVNQSVNLAALGSGCASMRERVRARARVRMRRACVSVCARACVSAYGMNLGGLRVGLLCLEELGERRALL